MAKKKSKLRINQIEVEYDGDDREALLDAIETVFEQIFKPLRDALAATTEGTETTEKTERGDETAN